MTTLPAAGSLRPTRTETRTVGTAEVTLQDRDRTRPFLLLHGGGGVATMAGFADLLAERTHSRVLPPTHPGFAGTPKAESLTGVTELARLYAGLLEELDLTDVTVVGNSFGGWLAAEIALLNSPRVSGAVIVDGIGIEVEGHPVTDISGMSLAEIRALSFHDPSKAPVPPAGGGTGPSPDVRALIGYTGPAMADPTARRTARRARRSGARHLGRERRHRRPRVRQGLRGRDSAVDVHPAAPHRPPAAGRDARRTAGRAPRPRQPTPRRTSMRTTLSVTRIGHACQLIEIGGPRVLIDPWFTQTATYYQGEPVASTVAGLDDEGDFVDAVLARRRRHRSRSSTRSRTGSVPSTWPSCRRTACASGRCTSSRW
ncbi:alpha/beta fold hydrolase [Amycolatopsis sp. NPDC058278]|uniref:alpha/beta fold hydrolase n=1 Tax=Amycolatopsis sp. NPDC058278 TaxID=3346417 RepID=UPI0036D8B04C